MSSIKNFAIGDYVFAKVRGFPAWPARIVEVLDARPASLKYNVYFYGTSETAACIVKDIYTYVEHKDKFGKPMKRKFFNEAIEELEKEMASKKNDGNSIANDTPIADGIKNTRSKRNIVEEKESKVDENTQVEKPADDEQKAKNKSEKSEATVVPQSKKSKRIGGSSAEQAENVIEVTGTKTRKRPSVSVNESNTTKDEAEEPKDKKQKLDKSEGSELGPKRARKNLVAENNAGEKVEVDDSSGNKNEVVGKKRKRSSVSDPNNKEQISRSGRVIKPKKFLDEEAALEEGDLSAKSKEEVPAKKSKKSHDDTTVKEPKKSTEDKKAKKSDGGPKKLKRSKGSPKKSEGKEDETVEEINLNSASSPPELMPMGRVVWLRSPCGQLVQVQIDHKRPANLKNARSRIRWEKQYAAEVKRMQSRISAGEYLPNEVKRQLKPSSEKLTEMTEAEIDQSRCDRVLERKRGQLRWLKLETRLVDIDHLLKISLQKTKVNMDKAISLLSEILTLPIDPLMLKKHSQIVETAKKIRFYMGNVDEWNMTDDELTVFKSKAAIVRAKANSVFNKYRSIFSVRRSEDFWTVFSNQVNEFDMLTAHLSPARKYSLTMDPSSPYYKEVEKYDEEELEYGIQIKSKMEKSSDNVESATQ